MKFESKHTFGKPASVVIKMFTDRAYFERKYKMLKFTEIEVLDHRKTDSQFSITVRYTAKNSVALPDFAKKFLPSTMVVTQTDTWDIKKMTGRLDVEIKGTPVKVSSDMTLKDEGKGSANTLKWNISCPIPLVGGKVEKLTADDINAKADDDVATTRSILADYS